jgi:hypothetical protein
MNPLDHGKLPKFTDLEICQMERDTALFDLAKAEGALDDLRRVDPARLEAAREALRAADSNAYSGGSRYFTRIHDMTLAVIKALGLEVEPT